MCIRDRDSAVEMREHAKRPGASPTSLEAINTGAYTTIHERAAMQSPSPSPITSQEASQITMPTASINPSHSQSVHSFSPQGMNLPQGIMAVFGHVKPLMPENGHAINQSVYQTVSHSGNNSFASSQSHFQSSQGQSSQGAGASLWQLPRGKNPLSQLMDKMVRNIVDLLF